MILQNIKSILFFFAVTALIFYLAHSLAVEPSEDEVVTLSQTGEVLALFEALQGVSFDVGYINAISREDRALSPEQVLRPLPSTSIGRKHPFSGRIVPLETASPTTPLPQERSTPPPPQEISPPPTVTAPPEQAPADGPLSPVPPSQTQVLEL